tara:strand:- start:325 stop:447 length:123 start_codon:yes stop_codon:yes gene_type:complete
VNSSVTSFKKQNLLPTVVGGEDYVLPTTTKILLCIGLIPM